MLIWNKTEMAALIKQNLWLPQSPAWINERHVCVFFSLFSYLLLWGNNASNLVLKACRQISESWKQHKIIPWENSDKTVKRRKTLFSVYQHFLKCVFQNVFMICKNFKHRALFFRFEYWHHLLPIFLCTWIVHCIFTYFSVWTHTNYRSMSFMSSCVTSLKCCMG